jgi:hypothetical protein
MAITRIKTNQITDLNVTTAKIANNAITGAKLANNLSYGSDFTVSGNLTVSGTTTSVSTTNTRVEDAIIALSAEATGSASVDSGLLINRGADDNQAFLWDESADQFILANVGAEDGDTAGNVSISSYSGLQIGALTSTSIDASGAVTITDSTAASSTTTGALKVTGGISSQGQIHASGFTGNLTGTADDADALSSAVTVTLTGDVTGSATFTSAGDTASIATTIAANSIALGTDTTGDYVSTITGGNGISSTGATSGETIAHSLSIDLTDTNIFASDGTASRAVVLDGSGDFSANMITSDLTGDVTGTADVATSITATANDSTNESVFITFVDGQTGAQGIETDIGLVYNPSTGALTSTSFVGALTGNADTADAMSSAVTVALTGDVTGTATFTSAGDTASIATTIAANSVALGTDTTGDYVGTITGGNGISSTGATSGEDIDHSLSIDLTDTNIFASDGTVSRAVVLDGSGDFSAGTITANIDGIIGANTPAAGTFTTITASGTTTLNGHVNIGNASGDTITVAGTTTFTPSVDFDGGFTVAASQTIDVGGNQIDNLADPTANQDAATKAYVDSQVSSGSSFSIAGDSGTDTVTIGSDTLTFIGTANEIETSVTNNQVQIGLPNDVTIGGDAVVTGNLTVNGTTTTLSTTNSVVSDSLIELNSGAGSNANDLGLIFERGSTGDNAVFAWDESADKFTLGTTTATGASTGDLTITAGTLVAALEGNASTATALETARTIALSGDVVGTVSFDGTGNVDISTTIQANSVALGTDTTGNYVATIADAGSGRITVTNSGSETAAVTLDIAANAITMGTHTAGDFVGTITGGAGIASTGATTGEDTDHTLSIDLTDTSVFNSDGTVSTAVVLDGSGDFSANMITANLTGDVTGTADVATSITATANNATDETVYITFVDGVSGSQGIETDTGLTYNPSSNILTTTTFSGALSGNATTATALETGRTITLTGDVTGVSGAFDGSGNLSFATTIAANSVALGTDTTGNYVADITGGAGISSTGATTGETISHTLSVDLTDTNIFASDGTVSRAVVLDGSGDFTANAITTTNIDGILGANTAAAASVTTLGTTGEATLASAIVSDLTSGRVVLAGTSGAIEDSGNLTFNGSTLAVTGAITASSNVDIADAGSLRVGTGNDFTINHDGTDTAITNGTGLLTIDGTATSAIRVNEAGANVDFVVEGDTNTALLTIDASQDNIGIGGAPNANAILDVNDTGAILLARGTTGERPTGVTGMFRYNTTSNTLEYYDNSGWQGISSDFTLATSQTFSGDNSTVAFTLSALTGADSYTVAGVLVMLNGVVQEPTTVYGISGTTLTFTDAPASGDLIEVRKFTTTTTVTAIADLDGDTQIQVEESADDDTIRFDIAGTEKAYINSTGLAVAGNITATGSITADGDITLGDASTDSVTFTAKIGSNMIPTTDGTYDLGDGTYRWAELHVDDVLLGPQGDIRFYDSDASNFVAFQSAGTVASDITWTLPNADASVSGYALVSDASGTLSWAAAGATTTSDTSTNAEEQLYFSDITSGAVTAVHHDADLTYNPSLGRLTSGAFAGDLTGDVTGNADTATTLATGRTISLTGDVTGTSGSFDGSGNVSISATIAANSVALGTDTTGNYVGAGATSGSGISGSVSSEGGTFTVTSNATSSNTANTIVFRNGSGNFSAGVITGTSTAARYADLAEMYAADAEIEPGTVVHFAGEGKLAACDTENCRTVAGIVSTDPAHLMNSEQEGVALALAGRVPCKVTGVVNAGDLMVSAGNGMAMANNNAAIGTVIGKAIEANEGGEGVIEVLALMM